mmetsp:Transcript_22671/g.31982  ORF Transcript_22671/g.31982 Transcript_22671/m.31982 type:complete len:192 (-) Transcript_22671:154-729(-)
MVDLLSEIDRISNRVSLSALSGLILGASISTLKGHALPASIRTSLSTSMSCALAGTACFVPERLAHHLIQSSPSLTSSSTTFYSEQHGNWYDFWSQREKCLVYSHLTGGMIGGIICGSLFRSKPFAGAFAFTPIMFFVGLAEIQWEENQRLRLMQLLDTSDNNQTSAATIISNTNASTTITNESITTRRDN